MATGTSRRHVQSDAAQPAPTRGIAWPVRIQVAVVRVVVDELGRALSVSEKGSGLVDQLADELQLLAAALRRSE